MHGSRNSRFADYYFAHGLFQIRQAFSIGASTLLYGLPLLEYSTVENLQKYLYLIRNIVYNGYIRNIIYTIYYIGVLYYEIYIMCRK